MRRRVRRALNGGLAPALQVQAHPFLSRTLPRDYVQGGINYPG